MSERLYLEEQARTNGVRRLDFTRVDHPGDFRPALRFLKHDEIEGACEGGRDRRGRYDDA